MLEVEGETFSGLQACTEDYRVQQGGMSNTSGIGFSQQVVQRMAGVQAVVNVERKKLPGGILNV
jgi:hypothetical protein